MAARVTFFEAMSHLAIDRQAIEPVGIHFYNFFFNCIAFFVHKFPIYQLGSGLLCACHYDKLYSVCRVPGEQIDELVNYGKYFVFTHFMILETRIHLRNFETRCGYTRRLLL